MTPSRRSCYVLAAFTILMLAAAVVLAALAPSRNALVFVIVGPLALLPSVLSILVVRRGENDRVAVLLGLVGATAAHVCAKENFRSWLATDHDRAERFVWLEAIWDQSALLTMAAVALLLLYFPNGRTPTRRWSWVPTVLLAAVVLEMGYAALAGSPFRAPLDFLPRNEPPAFLSNAAGSESPPFFLVAIMLTFACAVSLAVRYAKATEIDRVRIKWVALGGFGVALYPFVCIAEIAVWGDPQWGSIVVLVAGLVGIPVGVGIAMLRHDLYDVDRSLITVVTWTLATALLLVFYGAATGIAGAVVGKTSVPVAVTVTVIAALAFAPVRALLQRHVDRRLAPQRRAAALAIEGLHRDVAAGAARPEQLEQRLRIALRDPLLDVDLDVARNEGVPVELGGAPIGWLVPGRDGPSYEVLRDVASKATTMIEVLRVRKELGQALQRAEATRMRLVQIGYEERKRLERDLHDGAQQRLVSLGMSLRIAQRHLADGSVDVPGLLDQSVAELGTAVAELRQIAHGLRPSALDDGLPAAITRLVRNVPMPVDLDVVDMSLPDDVATTAYFVISEAVTNAVKHSGATGIVLKVTRNGDDVMVQVADDGRGGAVIAPSSTLADRVAVLGGRLAVSSPTGRGTMIEVALPCAS